MTGNFAVHGRFDERARRRSWQWSISVHRVWFILLALIAVAAADVLIDWRAHDGNVDRCIPYCFRRSPVRLLHLWPSELRSIEGASSRPRVVGTTAVHARCSMALPKQAHLEADAMNCPMMDMAGMGWMMVGMGVFWLLLVVALVLGIAALWKYLRSDRSRSPEAGRSP